MFKYLKLALGVGVATQNDPLVEPDVDKNFRGMPKHDPAQCIACSACINACPANALSCKTDLAADKQHWQFNLGRCIFCARCEEVCPTGAIELSQEVQMAVWKKEDLYQKAAFPIAHCIECDAPFAVAKELDYAEALLLKAGQYTDKEALHQQLHTCPACKRQHNLIESQRTSISRLIRESAS